MLADEAIVAAVGAGGVLMFHTQNNVLPGSKFLSASASK